MEMGSVHLNIAQYVMLSASTHKNKTGNQCARTAQNPLTKYLH